MFFIELITIIFLGLSLGSFISMASYRVGKQEKIGFYQRSFCPKCKNKLGVMSLVPFFSWIFQRGKCRSCNEKISIRYPLIEVLFLFIYIFLYFFISKGINLSFLLLTLLFVVITIGIITDFENYFVPNYFNKICFILALFWQIFSPFLYSPIVVKNITYFLLSSFIFWLFSFLLRWAFIKIRKVDPLGMGDIGFFAVCGLILGIELFNYFILLTGIFGVLLGVMWKKISKEEYFPFIPPMVLSLMICMTL
jgi:leader peptidase (prepilin peptidase)/N-methyltransferase